MRIFLPLYFFLLFITHTLQPQVADTLPDIQIDWAEEDGHYADEEEFNLFLFSMVGAFIVICICVGVGIVSTLLGLLLLFGLIAAGALSTSLLVGLNKKSFTTGFKTFVILFSTLSCTVLGGIGFYLLVKITHWMEIETATLSGLGIGLISGLILGFTLSYIIQKFTTYLKAKLGKYKEGR